MAFKRMIMTITIIAAILPSITQATQYTVGDEEGWKLKVNYTQWAEGKEFFVGDSFVFKYPPSSHNVLKVTGPEFKACQAQEGAAAPLKTGNDVVALKTPGRKWYICGVEGHCGEGMKLVITVKDRSMSPAPAPQSAAEAAVITYFGIVVAAVFAVMIIAF